MLVASIKKKKIKILIILVILCELTFIIFDFSFRSFTIYRLFVFPFLIHFCINDRVKPNNPMKYYCIMVSSVFVSFLIQNHMGVKKAEELLYQSHYLLIGDITSCYKNFGRGANHIIVQYNFNGKIAKERIYDYYKESGCKVLLKMRECGSGVRVEDLYLSLIHI